MTALDVISGNASWAVDHSDCLAWLRSLPAACVHCCVSSPPYFALRDYKIAGQIGLEPTPEAFVQTMVEVYREVRRVLRPDGVAWLNLGDSFANDTKWGGNGSGPTSKNYTSGEGGCIGQKAKRITGLKPLDLMNIPHRVAAALQADGWYWRSTIVWAKKAPMPESVNGWRWEKCRVKVKAGIQNGNGKQAENRLTAGFNERWYGTKKQENGHSAQKNGEFVPKAEFADCPGCKKCQSTDGFILRRGAWRPTRSHEYVFMLTKSDRYYTDPDAVRTALAEATVSRDQYTRILDDPDEQFAVKHDHESTGNPAGANIRDVQWLDAQDMPDVLHLGPSPLRMKHYAAFPWKLVEPLIKAATTEEGVCGKCGAPWARMVAETTGSNLGSSWMDHSKDSAQGKVGSSTGVNRSASDYCRGQTLGWRPTCSCSSPSIPALVMDHFGGSGTTVMVARRLGRRGISCDLNPQYCEMARKRIREDMPLMNSGGSV